MRAPGIGLHSLGPLSAGSLSEPGGTLDEAATRHEATPSQIALAWLLRRSPAMLLIPGTSKVSHLEENLAAVGIELSAKEFAQLDGGAPPAS